jgi:hypothetical protein
MIFTALGTTIFIDTNPHNRGDNAPPTFVYDTETAALTVGPRIPSEIDGLATAMAVGETLYVVTTPADLPDHMPCLQALSWARTATDNKWDPDMDWSWSRLRSSQPPCLVENILCSEDDIEDGTVLHVTFFALKYDHMGELRTKLRRGTRSYAVSKNTGFFSHAAFWM